MFCQIMLSCLKIHSLLEWKKDKDIISCKFKDAKIKTKKIIFATNGFLKSLGIKSNYNFPITLTASMTRSLTDTEFESMVVQKSGVYYP